jgi:predicted  nucleic acid-binding Zn-ribbon protein
MDLIIEQQAQFAADIQRSKEIQEAEANLWREKYNSLTDAMTTVVGWIGKLAQGQTELTEAQKRTEAQVAETNERLNVFINVVERYINEHRNGQARSGNEEPEPPK